MKREEKRIRRTAAIVMAVSLAVTSLNLSAIPAQAETEAVQTENKQYDANGFCVNSSIGENGELVHNDGSCTEDGCIGYQPANLTEGKYDIDDNKVTVDKVYEISNAGQLYWFAGLVNGDSKVCDYNVTENPNGLQQNTAANAILTNDITINVSLLTELITVNDTDGSATVNEGKKSFIMDADWNGGIISVCRYF